MAITGRSPEEAAPEDIGWRKAQPCCGNRCGTFRRPNLRLLRPSIQGADHDPARRARPGAFHRPTGLRGRLRAGARPLQQPAARSGRGAAAGAGAGSGLHRRPPDDGGLHAQRHRRPGAARGAREPGRRGRQPSPARRARAVLPGRPAALGRRRHGPRQPPARPPPGRPSARPVRAAAHAHGGPGAGPVGHAARPHRPRARPMERRRHRLRLRAGHARLRPRGMQRVRARRGAGPGGAGAQSARHLGGACGGARLRDAGPRATKASAGSPPAPRSGSRTTRSRCTTTGTWR